jgi:plasmid stability protein
MKSITIHKLDDETERALVGRAEREGLSLNGLVKRLLREALGLGERGRNQREVFAEFCGRWGEEEGKAFEAAMAGFGEIDEEVWQ